MGSNGNGKTAWIHVHFWNTRDNNKKEKKKATEKKKEFFCDPYLLHF